MGWGRGRRGREGEGRGAGVGEGALDTVRTDKKGKKVMTSLFRFGFGGQVS